ncbi:MAG: hypothetical protein KGP28_04625 [Bdellovibrionales bacterium]|nr:hypothetical protein [Bdellovibrionales bacterium]
MQSKAPYLKAILPPGSEEGAKWSALLHPRLAHGGPASRGKRKTKRPYFSNVPQIVLLNSKKAKGLWDLAHRRHRSRITSQIYIYAKRFRVRVFSASVQKGQIQLLVKAADRKDLADFFRVLAGRVAVSITGARKGIKRIGKFWDELCFSKMMNWGLEFHQARNLILQSRGPLDPGGSALQMSVRSHSSRGS